MKKLILLVCILLLAFIWGNSILPASASSRESEFVKGILAPLFRLLTDMGISADSSWLVRKIAHFSEYMAFGISLCLLLSRDNWMPRFWATAGLCAVTACIDECIQIFSAGRGPGLKDVLLDISGALTGIALAALVILLATRTGKKERGIS